MPVSGNRYKDLIRLGLPIMVGQLGMILLSFADTIMVGRCGTEELGAASFVNNMFNLVIVFSTGFSYGLTPIVGSLHGENDVNSIGRFLRNSLSVNSLAAVMLTVVMALLFVCIPRLGQPVELLPLIRPYYIVLLVSLIFVLLFNAFRQFSEGITNTLTPMFILLGGNVLNIVGNWLLIYGKCGFPALGLTGAGIATLFSRVMMVVAFVVVFFCSAKYRKYVPGFMSARLDRHDFILLNKMGMPVGLQMGLETAAFSLTTIMVGWLGTTALAAHQVMLTVSQLGFMMYYGMAAAVSVRISNFKGTGNVIGIRQTAGAGFRLILFMAFFVAVLMLAFRSRIGYLFTDSTEVAVMVAQLVIPFVIYQIGDGMQCNYSNALRGIADVKMVTIYAFIAYFLVSLPSAYILGFVFDLGLVGIWLSFPIGLTTAGLLFLTRFRRSLKLM